MPSVPRDKLDNAVWHFIEALYNNPNAVLVSFQEAQLERHRENAATEARITDLEHTLSEQRTKQENLWEEVAILPKGATSAKTALHNVIHRLDEAIAEGVEKVMALRATLSPVPDSEALTTLWEHREQIREGLRGADTIEKRRRVVDALNVTVSVRGVDGKPKATLHWWGMDTPLSFDDDTPSSDGGPGKAPMPGLGEAKKGGGDIPILRAKRHIRSPIELA